MTLSGFVDAFFGYSRMMSLSRGLLLRMLLMSFRETASERTEIFMPGMVLSTCVQLRMVAVEVITSSTISTCLFIRFL